MDKLIVISSCEDGSCCCLPPRSTVTLIPLLSLVVCVADVASFEPLGSACCSMKQYVECARHVLTLLFQLANVLLIAAAIMENAKLTSIYIWYALSYVVLGLCLSILELLCRLAHDAAACLALFGSEVAFYFVISWCLPIVNSYKQQLDDSASRNTFQ